MKTLMAAAVVALAFSVSTPAYAADGVRCGPTGQFYGYGARAKALAKSGKCWVLEAESRGNGGGNTATE